MNLANKSNKRVTNSELVKPNRNLPLICSFSIVLANYCRIKLLFNNAFLAIARGTNRKIGLVVFE